MTSGKMNWTNTRNDLTYQSFESQVWKQGESGKGTTNDTFVQFLLLEFFVYFICTTGFLFIAASYVDLF